MEIAELEEKNVSKVEYQVGIGDADFSNGYCQPIKIFDIHSCNARIMKSTIIPTLIADGPLHEDQLLPPRTFLSHERHS